MEKFILGLALGMAGGALIVANNCKIRQLIKKNQQEVMQKAEEYIDEQLQKSPSPSTAENKGKKTGEN